MCLCIGWFLSLLRSKFKLQSNNLSRKLRPFTILEIGASLLLYASLCRVMPCRSRHRHRHHLQKKTRLSECIYVFLFYLFIVFDPCTHVHTHIHYAMALIIATTKCLTIRFDFLLNDPFSMLICLICYLCAWVSMRWLMWCVFMCHICSKRTVKKEIKQRAEWRKHKNKIKLERRYIGAQIRQTKAVNSIHTQWESKIYRHKTDWMWRRKK